MATRKWSEFVSNDLNRAYSGDAAMAHGKFPLDNLVQSLAPVFSASTAYSAGDAVMHQGKLWRFTADHAAGDWTGSDAVEVDVATLNSDKANLIKTYSKLSYTVNSGSFIDVKSYNGASYSQSSARNIVITSEFTPGDTIYVSGLSSSSSNYGLIGFFGSRNNSLGYYFERDTEFTRKAFVIPTGTTEIRVNGTTLSMPAVEIISAVKDLSDIDDEQFIERFFSNNAFARIEELQKSCPFSMTISSPVISFVFDDTLEDVKEIADLFKTKGLGCCFATIPSRLSDYVLNSNSITRGAALLAAQLDGCEILVHGLKALSSSSTDAQVYNLFVGNKIKLANYGFSVDGIIELGSGGNEKTFDYARCEKYLKDLYRYSDYYGTGLNLPQYFTNNRVWMTSDLDDNKNKVDSIVSGTSWKLLSAHDVVGGVGLQTLSDTIDYAISEGCEILTMRAVYNKYSNR